MKVLTPEGRRGIFNYGSANFMGSAGSTHLNASIVGMASYKGGHR